MRVHVAARGVRAGVAFARLRAAARRAMRLVGLPRAAEVEVALVDDATIARLNRRFLGHRGPTDVLTFPAGPRAGDRVVGEIVISVDQARRQAREAGWGLAQELALLVVHGVLHLGGYDDRTAAQARRMRRAEAAVLAALRGAVPTRR